MIEHNFLIPIEPKGKGRPRFTRSGHCFTDKQTVSTEEAIRMSVKSQFDGTPHEGACLVNLGLYLKKAKASGVHATKKPDLDNAAKLVLDALNGVLWVDDKNIVGLVVTKQWADGEPCIRMIVSFV